MRILFTGGGTGGHIYPIISVKEKLQKKGDAEFFYAGAPGDFYFLLTQNGIKSYKILSAKWRRYFDLRNFLDIPKFFISIMQALWRIFWIMPDVLFSKGGPGSMPVVLASKFYGIPVIIHESDSTAGLTNLISAKYADRIAISFPSAQDSFLSRAKSELDRFKIADKIALTGNPIREFLLKKDKPDQAAARKLFGLDPKKPVLLVLCGSQGASRINDFFLEAARELVMNGYQIMHQTGAKNFEGFNRELNFMLEHFSKEQKAQYKTFAYFDENIKDVYIAADIVVSRSGSGSIFETAAMGKPAILLPLPEDIVGIHQVKNAYEYSRAGAAIMIEENNLKPSIFLTQLQKIFSNPQILNSMSQAATAFAKPQAAQTIADEILKLALR